MTKSQPRLSPATRKKHELEQDHHSSSQHGLRKKWSRLKSPENRIERHAVTVKARKVLADASDSSDREDLELHVVVPRWYRPRKDTLASVGVRVARTSAARAVWQVGYRRYFSKPYEAAVHRDPFKAFLRTLMSGGTANSKLLAAHYLACLSSPEAKGVDADTARFLQAFRADDPGTFGTFILWARNVTNPRSA